MAEIQTINACLRHIEKLYTPPAAWFDRARAGFADALSAFGDETVKAAFRKWVDQHPERHPNAVQIASLCREARVQTASQSSGCEGCASGWVDVAVHRDGWPVLPMACRCTCDAGSLHVEAMTVQQLQDRAEAKGNQVVVNPRPGPGGLRPVGWVADESRRAS